MTRSALALVALLVAGCSPPPRPTRIAVSRALPVASDDRALVVFLFPPCASYEGDADSPEESKMCRRFWQNRIRVVEHGARLVTDIDVGEYGASYETPGHHVYAAYHRATSCLFGRWDCLAALEADLEPGMVYFVTFRWVFIASGRRSMYGRLDFVPIAPEQEGPYRARLAQLERVEPIPGFRERGEDPRELRSVMVSSLVMKRIDQDREDGVHTPALGLP